MGGFKSDLGEVFQGLEARFFRLRGVRDGEAHSVSFQWLDVADRFHRQGGRGGSGSGLAMSLVLHLVPYFQNSIMFTQHFLIALKV